MGKRGRPARIIRCAKPAKCPNCGNRHFLIVVYKLAVSNNINASMIYALKRKAAKKKAAPKKRKAAKKKAAPKKRKAAKKKAAPKQSLIHI